MFLHWVAFWKPATSFRCSKRKCRAKASELRHDATRPACGVEDLDAVRLVGLLGLAFLLRLLQFHLAGIGETILQLEFALQDGIDRADGVRQRPQAPCSNG
jgi:hypothetical protein